MNFFTNALGTWGGILQIVGWAIVLLLPPAILLLYFLKLRRQPVQVPSTYLWARTIEDLHVNSIWQRLRRSLLLFLQLLVAALIIFALLRPGWRGEELKGDRFIFLIDTSASMAAKVDGKTRLEIAKEKTYELIDRMKPGDTAMLISFSDRANPEQSFVDNRGALRRKLANIQQTQHRTDLDEALRAASGLANPGRSSQDDRDIQVADALAATLYIISDGGVAKVPDFSLGNLEPVYLAIGAEREPNNIGIVDFAVEANPEDPSKREAFARVINGGAQDAEFAATLYLNDRIHDSRTGIQVAAGADNRISFDLNLGQGVATGGILRLEIEHEDDLDSDNTAFVVFNPPRRAKVLLVTLQNPELKTALSTIEAEKISIVEEHLPSYLSTEEYLTNAGSGYYDLIIFDRCAPEEMPEANTLFIAAQPPDENWKLSPKQSPVQIVDSAQTHPLMSLIETGNILIADSADVNGPAGSAALIESSFGPIFAIGPRGGYEDAIMGFAIVDTDDKGESLRNTDWTRYISFPLFVQNVLNYLGSRSTMNTLANVAPGETVQLRSSVPAAEIQVTPPGSSPETVKVSRENTFIFSNTEHLGVYDITEGSSENSNQQFAVNILDKRESDLRVADNLEIGFETIGAQQAASEKRFELWKWVLLFGLVLLCFEWYVYNRRVYL